MSRQAIETRYLPAIGIKGARISAKCNARRIVRERDYDLLPEQDHARVAHLLAAQLKWGGKWVQGTVPSNPTGYVFVMFRTAEGHEEGTEIVWDVDELRYQPAHDLNGEPETCGVAQ